MRTSILVVITSIFLSFNLHAETQFDYPELVVAPKATDRILMQAKKEKAQGFFHPMAMQISAATTLVASILHSGEINEKKDPDKTSNIVGLVVGAGWLGFNYFYFNKTDYYFDAYSTLKKMPSKTKEQELARERIAEEALANRASMAKKFAWISMATNFGASLYMAMNVNKDSTAEVIDYLAAVTSILPLIFQQDEITVYNTHKSYKKKIYAPLVQTKLFYNQAQNKFIPGINLSYSF